MVVLGLDILILVWHPSAVGTTNKECKENIVAFIYLIIFLFLF